MLTVCSLATDADVADILSTGNVYMFIPNRVDRALAEGRCELRTYRDSPNLIRCHPDYEYWFGEAMNELLPDRDYFDLSEKEQLSFGTRADRKAVASAWVWCIAD